MDINYITKRQDELTSMEFLFNGGGGGTFVHKKYNDIHFYFSELLSDSDDEWKKKIILVKKEIWLRESENINKCGRKL